MLPDADLGTLMARYQHGDADAATALVNCLSPLLHRFFMVQCVSRRYADDLLQETWLRLHQVRQTYRPGEPVLPWLYALARHVRVDHYRRTRRVESRERQLEQLPDVLTPAQHRPDNSPDLTDLLAGLPESQREVVVMLKLSDMSLDEVARATSSTIGSVKQKAHRAYASLRQRLAGMGLSQVRPGDRHE